MDGCRMGSPAIPSCGEAEGRGQKVRQKAEGRSGARCHDDLRTATTYLRRCGAGGLSRRELEECPKALAEYLSLLPSAFCLLPSAFCLLPSAFCLLPSPFFLLPSALPSALC